MDTSTATATRATGPSLLVGRSREQAVLREELAVATGSSGRLVLVGGEAGIGKTTLVRALVGEAEKTGIRVLAGHCYDLTNTPPYGPWLDLFDACERDRDLPPPPDAFAGGQLARVSDQAALFAEVRRFFAALTASHPAIIVLEDLHWADPASLELLRHLGAHVRHWPVLLIATYRGDELTPNRPFAQHLPALVREGDGRRIDLRRLDTEALRALVVSRCALPRADEDRLVAYLAHHAEGNPFFATELLRTLEEEGLLRREGGGWTLAALDRTIVPSLLKQVIDGRIGRLGEETRKPLALAAVIGQEVPLALWAEMTGLAEEHLFDIVEQAVAARLLEAEQDGVRVRFVHALTREALYDGILPPRRRVWHRHVAETLMTSAHADPDAVAFHLQEAGDPRAWEWLVKSGDRAQRAYAWLTAAERLRAAVALLEGVEGEVGARVRLLYRLAHLQRFSDPVGALTPLTEYERLAARAGDAVLTAQGRYARGLLLCYSDRFRDGLSTMVDGIEALEAIPKDVADVLATIRAQSMAGFTGTDARQTSADELAAARLRAAGLDWLRFVTFWFGASAGKPRDAIAAGEQYLAVLADLSGATEGIRYAASFVHHGLGIAYAALGRPDSARERWATARTIFRDLDHHVLVAFTLLNELWDLVYPFGTADPATRRRYAAEAAAALERAGGALPPGISPRLASLSCFVLDGRWEEVLGIVQDLPTPGNSYLRREVTGTHATIARHRGDPATAWQRIRPLFPAGPATNPGDIIHQEGLSLQRLAADLCLDAGDLPMARAWLTAHDRWLAWSDIVLGRAEGALSWARWHHAAGDVPRARGLAAEALDLATAPDQPLVRLGAHRLLGEAETVAGQHAAAEAHLTTALALADACAVPFERAGTLLATAALRLAMGATGDAATLLGEVRRICTPLGAVPTLARAAALAGRAAKQPPAVTQPAGLTQREVDVLRLLAAHRTDQEIAEALFVGRRTVQTHVANILGKLGAENRRAAAVKAADLGLV